METAPVAEDREKDIERDQDAILSLKIVPQSSECELTN